MNPRNEPSSFEVWRDARFEKGERLVAFESWVAEQLGQRLKWPSDPAKSKKQVLQCRAFVLQAVADMGRHGYLFDAKRIAKIIIEMLDDIGDRQRRGEINDLYPYFKSVWRGYVGQRSEELKIEALRGGHHISQASAKVASIPVIIDQDRRESIHEQKLKAAERRKRACKADADDTLPLFKFFE